MTAGAAILEVQNVTKQLGVSDVLRGVSLRIHRGERVLLCGANGSGKTTLLRIIVGLSRATTGLRETLLATQDIGYVSHSTLLYGELTAAENIRFFGRLYGKSVDENAVLKAWGVQGCAMRRVDTLSRGQQMRVSLARAVLHEPQLLAFDEPTSPLDDDGCRLLRHALTAPNAAGDARTVIMATHDVERVAETATRILVLAGGKIVADSGEGVVAADADKRAVFERYREGNR